MSVLALTVELSNLDDSCPTNIHHLILRVELDGKAVEQETPLSHKSSSGVWKPDKTLILETEFTELRISVLMEIDTNEHQLLGFVELNQSILHSIVGKLYEAPLIREDSANFLLKTRVISIKNTQEPVAGVSQETPLLSREGLNQKIIEDALAACRHSQSQESLESLEQVILLLEIATEVTKEDDPRLLDILGNLGASLLTRYKHLGNMTDLDHAIFQMQRVIDLTPVGHSPKAIYLKTLVNSLEARFQRLGDNADLDNAISRLQTAVNLTPRDHPHKAIYLGNLGSFLQKRFQRAGNIADINDAVSHNQMANHLTPDGHPSKPTRLSNLGNTLEIRFRQLGELSDLENSISHLQVALKIIPESHPSRPIYLNNLGKSFETRFKRLGNDADLDNAILQKQMSVNFTPDGHPSKPGRLNNLGNSLETRFRQLGKITDLDDSISLQQMAVDLTPETHPNKSMYLSNLGNSLEARFRRLGNLADLDNSILQKQMAVDLTPDNHPEKPNYLNNLGSSLWTRFQQGRSPVELESAIEKIQMAVDLTREGDPFKATRLNNLANCIEARFRRLLNVADLDNAIQQRQMAVELTPDGYLEKPAYLSNLGVAFETRFKQLGNVADLDNAISQKRMAAELTPDSHPDKSLYLKTLGKSVQLRFFHLRQPQDAESAISHLSAAVLFPFGIPTTRLKAAQEWIPLASQINHASLMTACECALELLPHVAWLGLPIPGRHQHLISIGAISQEAAAIAISLGQHDKALEWLEQGRSIVWTQILQLRTPVDRLRDVDPELADRLIHVSQLLDRGTEQSGISKASHLSLEESGRRHRAPTVEWESIVNKVRSLPGFEDFLRPPRSRELKNASRSGPVIVLNITKKQCDALALLKENQDIVHIPLSNVTYKGIAQLRDELKDILCSSRIRMRGERAAKKISDETNDESCKHILAELWNRLVKPIVDFLGLSARPDVLPHIWWCVTGPLAFLPIHAAGIYEPDLVDSQLSSYVISSYIPSLSALLEPPEPNPNSTFQLLSVIQSSAPGAASILNTEQELEYIRNRLGNRQHVILEGATGTKKRVTKAMEECNWLHLACHGIQKPEDPTKSALILEDGHLTLEEIIKLNLPKAEFAFLSACQTTTGDERLSEEAVHIAGGMLLAGYRGVVATMWSIRDELAPEVANEFYGHIMKDGEQPDSRRAAEALHHSLQKLRRRLGAQLTDWIPFVHLGL